MAIKVGDLVVQRRSHDEILGLVILLRYGRSPQPKNEPDLIYEYALVQWLGGRRVLIKTSLLKKVA